MSLKLEQRLLTPSNGFRGLPTYGAEENTVRANNSKCDGRELTDLGCSVQIPDPSMSDKKWTQKEYSASGMVYGIWGHILSYMNPMIDSEKSYKAMTYLLVYDSSRRNLKLEETFINIFHKYFRANYWIPRQISGLDIHTVPKQETPRDENAAKSVSESTPAQKEDLVLVPVTIPKENQLCISLPEIPKDLSQEEDRLLKTALQRNADGFYPAPEEFIKMYINMLSKRDPTSNISLYQGSSKEMFLLAQSLAISKDIPNMPIDKPLPITYNGCSIAITIGEHGSNEEIHVFIINEKPFDRNPQASAGEKLIQDMQTRQLMCITWKGLAILGVITVLATSLYLMACKFYNCTST